MFSSFWEPLKGEQNRVTFSSRVKWKRMVKDFRIKLYEARTTESGKIHFCGTQIFYFGSKFFVHCLHEIGKLL